jgi:hypothetical protein
MQEQVGADSPEAAEREHDDGRREAVGDIARAAQMAFARASRAVGI